MVILKNKECIMLLMFEFQRNYKRAEGSNIYLFYFFFIINWLLTLLSFLF